MNEPILILFDKHPAVLPLYEQLEARILAELSGVSLKVGKTQVSFSNRYGFAWAWPPYRKIKAWPASYLGVSFGLGDRLEHPRIVEAANPYPNRWTHHVLVTAPEQIDDQLMQWITASYHFSLSKR